MNIILLGPTELSMAAILLILLALTSRIQGIHIEKQLLIAALRTTIQLSLIGLVLKVLFAQIHLGWMALLATLMLGVAGREVMARQERQFTGWWGFGIGSFSMFLSSFVITILALTLVISPQPWYQPQYAIPLLGMMLGNTMTSIALAMDHLTQTVWRERHAIETRLTLGHTWQETIRPLRRDAVRKGMIPSINAMASAGVVSIPGMMTGQILGGSPPMTAVNYQILIMFLITAGTGFGATAAIWLGSRRLFDQRHRLRLDHLTQKKGVPTAKKKSTA